MHSNDVFVLLIIAMTVLLPMVFIGYIFRRYFAYREKRLEAEMGVAAEKAAQYAADNAKLEQRVRVLEQIVTDAGAETAAQIEALRDRPAPKVQEGGRA